ncbi:photosynthetic complex putative assembly protein PuhB [Glacieibacterium sp.]|uniref:photosynthetic complex putative assembly protein PuhB n=1 Tax=Glacieibacterium sp. TaxID=2860237 RepID=UPI003AFFDFCC
MSEYEFEPVRGLPGKLPPGETLLWQGAPDWRRLARDAFHVRLVAAYFAVLLGWAAIDGTLLGVTATLVVGVAGVAMLYLLAWLSARTTVYSITSRRVVLRFGIALPKCVNLPFTAIETAQLAQNDDGSGNVALALTARGLGYASLWPHARAWEVSKPQPMLRALPDAAKVATLLAEACATTVPGSRRHAIDDAATASPGYGNAVAA